ncbi:SDR family oxidoreductase [Roseinatronobacter sp.]|uniref:SDR family NAD(P)-dependent oxidoreductase n=1 Tax=Roseinatronobacter sp. TaxID=1945755 RepID=UPI0025E7CC7D|nr:SDR family NAD(P)-dependent oxidoreductase [Rhodobaca sp.]
MNILLTGAASGLGAALLHDCIARGDSITVIDVGECPPDMPETVTWLRHDLSAIDPVLWDEISTAFARHGPFDLAVLSAGISATGPFEAISPQAHRQVSRVNLHAPMRLSLELQQRNALAAGGRLVFVASLSCFTGYPGAASYAASKDGLAAFARSLRKPMRRAGVAVQLLCPGPMDTPHATRYAPKGARADRRIAPEKVAQMVLDAPRARFVLLPGAGAKLAAMLGRLAPELMTRIMGRVLFAKLKDQTML